MDNKMTHHLAVWSLDIKGELGQPATRNARILTSRNKREGKFLLNESKIYKKTRYGKLAPVNFADLGIKLYTPTGEPNGTT
jgi:hypothetical protein